MFNVVESTPKYGQWDYDSELLEPSAWSGACFGHSWCERCTMVYAAKAGSSGEFHSQDTDSQRRLLLGQPSRIKRTALFGFATNRQLTSKPI